MKKISAFMALIFTLLLAVQAFAAGSCTESYGHRGKTNDVFRVVLTCTGDASGGSIPSQDLSGGALNEAMGMYLYSVIAYPTSGGTAPDAADITVTMDGMDLLGGKGVNLIHATATQDTFPYSTFMSSYRFPAIVSTPTVAVANQGTNSANFTIVLVFVKN